mmetsp:Transcript_2565/g.5836  ORF Transcript_2565/g.5836 Transcript_2565/m.5836 type:complete len:611 (+) Transcript_2565:22-1854(+)
MDDQLNVSITPEDVDGHVEVKLQLSFTDMLNGPAAEAKVSDDYQVFTEVDFNEPSETVSKDQVTEHFTNEFLVQAQPKPVLLTREEELMKLVSAMETQIEVLSQQNRELLGRVDKKRSKHLELKSTLEQREQSHQQTKGALEMKSAHLESSLTATLYSKESLEQDLSNERAKNEQLQQEFEGFKAQSQATLEQKQEHIRQLLNSIKERDKRKGMAEILLAKEEQTNKQLLENSIRQEKRAIELEKRLKELQIYHERVKEDNRKTEAVLIQRDSQLKQLLSKIRSMEKELIVMTDELKKKEAYIEQLKRSVHVSAKEAEFKSTTSSQRTTNSNIASRLSAKESELKLMKEMMKSYHVQYRQKSGEVQRFKRNVPVGVKLPSLSTRGSEPSEKATSYVSSSKTDLGQFEVPEADIEESYPDIPDHYYTKSPEIQTKKTKIVTERHEEEATPVKSREESRYSKEEVSITYKDEGSELAYDTIQGKSTIQLGSEIDYADVNDSRPMDEFESKAYDEPREVYEEQPETSPDALQKDKGGADSLAQFEELEQKTLLEQQEQPYSEYPEVKEPAELPKANVMKQPSVDRFNSPQLQKTDEEEYEEAYEEEEVSVDLP